MMISICNKTFSGAGDRDNGRAKQNSTDQD